MSRRHAPSLSQASAAASVQIMPILWADQGKRGITRGTGRHSRTKTTKRRVHGGPYYLLERCSERIQLTAHAAIEHDFAVVLVPLQLF